jgi:predicted Zn-dependent protease
LLIGSLSGLIGRWDQAISELQLHLKAYPNDPRGSLEMGVVYIRAGKSAAALPFLERAATSDPGSYDARYRLGEAYVTTGKYAAAIPELRLATRLNGKKAEPFYLLYRAYRGLNEKAQAASALREFEQRRSRTL